MSKTIEDRNWAKWGDLRVSDTGVANDLMLDQLRSQRYCWIVTCLLFALLHDNVGKEYINNFMDTVT